MLSCFHKVARAIVLAGTGISLLAAATAFAQDAAEPGHDAFDAYRGDRSTGWLGQTRSEVMSLNGMVATSQPLAAEAGIEVLHAGGNAFDAAVATAAAINVVEPEATGIGGDMFVIAWVAKEHRLVALDASGRAPLAATLDHYRKAFGANMPEEGLQSAVVPGRGRWLGHVAGQVWQTGAGRSIGSGNPDCRAGLSGQPADRHRMADEHRAFGQGPGHRRDLSQPGQGLALGRYFPQSGPGQGVSPDCQRGAMRFTRVR